MLIFEYMNQLGKKSTWLQILFWGTVSILMQFMIFGVDHLDRVLLRVVWTFPAVALLVFFNLETLLPRLYFKKKTQAYILAGIGLIIAVYFLMEIPWWLDIFENQNNRGKGSHRKSLQRFKVMLYVTKLSPLIISMIGSSLFAIANFASSKEKEMAQLKSEKLKAEMDFLKSQINPHFLFNALNNIYTLSVIKSDNTPDNLLKLSGMLRYMLYDCKEDRVPLKKELEYIDNFIELHKLKDSQGLNIKLSLDRGQPDLMVAPLIFIPFIENAFKHSKIEDLEKGWIKINLIIQDKTLLFNVQNSVPSNHFTKDKVGGIGLKNVRRQLELVYPDKHDLKIEKTTEIFDISLKIFL